jgi:hypothetical protein
LVTVSVTRNPCPVLRGDGNAANAACRNARGTDVVVAHAAADVGVEPHLSPAAVTENPRGPAPFTEYVHVTVAAPPGSIGNGAEGIGPLTSVTEAPEASGPPGSATFTTSVSPGFERSNTRSTHCPTDTSDGRAKAGANDPGVVATPASPVAAPVVTGVVRAASVPEAVTVNATVPEPVVV